MQSWLYFRNKSNFFQKDNIQLNEISNPYINIEDNKNKQITNNHAYNHYNTQNIPSNTQTNISPTFFTVAAFFYGNLEKTPKNNFS